ncbi:MAG: extradiol ring-cleavage dioxygenase, partial [Hyphomicrobiales bacterium]|nr:extradiol ring-cleavage dioxygenase [Hyphomicrobiales bacterium]
IASGGLTHFVIDEAFDRKALDLMARVDRTGLAQLPEDHLQSGNSEIKNWMPVAVACGAADLKMDLVDYVPCYRSLAGTGTANAFAIWQ